MLGKNITVNDALWREVWSVVENAVSGGAEGGVWWAVGKSLSQVETAAEASTWTLQPEPGHPELQNYLRSTGCVEVICTTRK